MSSVSHLVMRVSDWSRENAAEHNLKECEKVLSNTLECVLVMFEHCTKSYLAQRSFELLFPRFTIQSVVPSSWKVGSNAVSDVIAAYRELDVTFSRANSTPSTASMIIFAHTEIEATTPSDVCEMMPIIVSSIQTGCALDEALAILLHGLKPRDVISRREHSEQIIHPLFAVLPTLSSVHPDPLVRHQAFRILTLVVSSANPLLRVRFLKDLAENSQFPQMRVAAIELIKEAALDGLAATSPNLFASPTFVNVFGPIIFRPYPPSLFSDGHLSLDSFRQSMEPARLVACLGLYYILLQRDTANLTHIRDNDMLHQVQATLLRPLKTMLEYWSKSTQSDVNNMIPFVSLQMILERVNEVMFTIPQK